MDLGHLQQPGPPLHRDRALTRWIRDYPTATALSDGRARSHRDELALSRMALSRTTIECMGRLRASLASTLRVARASGVIGACALAVACARPHPDDTRFTLALSPDASCAGATHVDLVDTLEVSRLSENGAVVETWQLPFDVNGTQASLGEVPRSGRGRFTARGTGPVCSVLAVAIFEGTSPLVTFDPGADQHVEVPVSCIAVAPCAEETPAPPAFASFQPADLVLGQPDYLTCDGGGIGVDRRFEEPDGIELVNDVLWVADRGFNRIAAFTPASTLTSGAQITFTVGQSGLGDSGDGDSSDALSHPRGVVALSDSLVALDGMNHRAQVTVPIPSQSGVAASFAIGQNSPSNENQVNAGGSTNLDTLDTPWGAVRAGGYFFVADSLNHRVLRIPLTSLAENRPSADMVLGQADFTSNLPNRGAAAGAETLNSPAHVSSDGTRLWVADAGNDRVLAYDLATLTSGGPATLVLTSGGGVNLAGPRGVAATPERLVIADSDNHRVLVWEPPPSSPADPPTAVLGQADFLGISANVDGGAGGCPTMETCADPGREPTARALSRPGAVMLSGDALWVSDTCNARVLRYKAPAR